MINALSESVLFISIILLGMGCALQAIGAGKSILSLSGILLTVAILLRVCSGILGNIFAGTGSKLMKVLL